jgi:hypothetical protein
MFVFVPALVFVFVCEFQFEDESEVDVLDCLRMRALDADETGIERVEGVRRRRQRRAETLGGCILEGLQSSVLSVFVSVMEENRGRECKEGLK